MERSYGAFEGFRRPGSKSRQGNARHSLVDHARLAADVRGERLGTLYLKSDMEGMYERFRLYSGTVVLVIAGSFGVAYSVPVR